MARSATPHWGQNDIVGTRWLQWAHTRGAPMLVPRASWIKDVVNAEAHQDRQHADHPELHDDDLGVRQGGEVPERPSDLDGLGDQEGEHRRGDPTAVCRFGVSSDPQRRPDEPRAHGAHERQPQPRVDSLRQVDEEGLVCELPVARAKATGARWWRRG